MYVMPHLDPAVIESRVNALRLADYYLRKGEDTFTFENEAGRAYVITRKMGVEHYLAAGDRLIGYTSPRLYDLVDSPNWSEPGRA